MDLNNYLVAVGLLVLLQLGYTNSNLMNNNDKQNFKDNIVLRDSNNSKDKPQLVLPLAQQQQQSQYQEKSLQHHQDLMSIQPHPQSPHIEEAMIVGTIDDSSSGELSSLAISDQVRLLSKQLNALMMRRREDYKLLENSLKKSIRRSTTSNENIDMDIRSELEQLRHEVKSLREGTNANKQRLMVEWMTQSIGEMRKELTELQEIAGNASKDLTRRRQNFEDVATITSDFKLFKLELESLKHRQEKTEVFVRELREEAIQREEDLQRMLVQRHEETKNPEIDDGSSDGSGTMVYSEPEADHRMRHHRFLRQQVHDLEESQRALKHQLNELQYHRIGERVRKLEIEQHRMAGANFNLSRQIVNLDKLHGSMLELLEDVEDIQTKIDKNIPDIRREISKLEFTSAQLNSEQSLLREEGHNAAKSIQAVAVSVSTLQDERDSVKDMQSTIEKLQQDVERLQSAANVHKSIVHRRIEKMESEADTGNNSAYLDSIETANNLVQQLESVELQYESIINKLPQDCSQVDHKSVGLYLIAPAGQHRPTMAHCYNGWTTIQRRFDGSVDFNRSWESYAQGFGSPSGEFWIGNDILHYITADNCTKLNIIMQDIYDNTWEAIYSSFYVSSRDDGYRLHISGYSGNASDALDYQNRMQFSAIDVDRDISNTHCAANYEGGWWFSHCQHANLNGRYNLGLTWFDASRNEWIAVKSSQMMVTKRPNCYANRYSNNNNIHSDSNTYNNDSNNSNHNSNNHHNSMLATASTTTTITTVV